MYLSKPRRTVPDCTARASSAVAALTTFFLLAGTTPAIANEIDWDDLLPPEIGALDAQASSMYEQLFKLEQSKREAYQHVAKQLLLEEQLENGFDPADLLDEDRALLKKDPAAAIPEAVKYWSEYKSLHDQITAANNSLSPVLDGKEVRLPGYLLPLELEGKKVREFLLVPYVGACIHTPPPPRNQMVFVKAPDGYEPEGLYEPIWVQGTMSTEGGTHSLDYVDGQADVDAGYSLRATKVEPYKY